MATLNSHGMEPREEAIMDAWDEGMSMDQIAAHLGISHACVNQIVKNFGEGKPDRWHLSAMVATDALLQAIARAHPEKVTV